MSETAQSALSPYRALDLTDEKGFLCGKILGDLGADVIKVEPPGGDPSRNIGPFHHDIPDPQRSLHWFAFNTSKRGITLDLMDPAGKDRFLRLVRGSDFVIESFQPGHMDKIGLGYAELSRINPGIILVSISPFGNSGPYRDFKGADIVAMAMGGQMSIAGHPDRPPVRITAPQSYLHAAAHAAVGALIALSSREAGGEGQQVDVSIQESVLRILANEPAFWEYSRNVMRRTGPLRPRDEILMREVWPCRDGEITYRVMSQGFQKLTPLLVQWMDEEGMAHSLKDIDWQRVDLANVTAADQASREEIIGRFFLKYTKDQIFQQALRRRIPIMPASTPADVRENRQLESRNFWVAVEHPELGEAITYPGAPFKLGGIPWKIQRRAPLIGEHNQEILDELASAIDHGQSFGAPGRTPGPKVPLPARALEGMRVVDFTRVITGPLITKYLAEFGAEVIKIESRSSLDAGRLNPPFKDSVQGLNRSGSFIFPNSSKRSLSLNMSHPQAQEIARGLIARADVVVENFAPGIMQKWGLDYEGVHRLRPDIIMLSTSTLGQTGPYATHPGFGWNLSGLGGFNHFTGWPDREGVAPSTAYTDYVAPWLGVAAVLSALDHRRRTGQGQYIDMSQFEASLTFLSPEVLDYTVNGRVQARKGNRCPHAAPHGAYPCRGDDRWCVIAVFTEAEWHSLCGAMGTPQWARDDMFATHEDRKIHEDELDSLVAGWTIRFTAEEAMQQLQAAGVAAGVVQSIPDIIDSDPHIRHRDYFPRRKHPEIGWCNHYGWPIKLSKTRADIRAAPLFGEANEYVCKQLLGLSGEQLLGLQAAGIFE